jgi:2-octaprenyl-6-methoxyphenol hydroxylase
MSTDFDILISGGGMAGASFAAALTAAPTPPATQGESGTALRIGLVEATTPGGVSQPSFDERTTVLSRTSRRILETLDVWRRLPEPAHPIRRIHVSERGRFGNTVIDAAEQKLDELGAVVANRTLGAALWDTLRGAPSATSRIELMSPARITAVTQDAQCVRADLELQGPAGILSSRTVNARLLVVADGADSSLRSAVGIGVQQTPYGQTAIIGNVQVSGPGEPGTAYERFTPEGPVAFLPFGERRFGFVLARETAQAQRLLALADHEFLQVLQGAFGARLGDFSRVGRRAAYPLSLSRAERVSAGRVVLIGNAANGLHPIAGQGYNLALRDAAALAELIIETRRAKAGAAFDAGDRQLLQNYVAWRQRDQAQVVRFTDGLIRLFGLPLTSVGRARGLGLLAFDILPGAKRALARHALGLGGRLTKAARGLRQ